MPPAPAPVATLKQVLINVGEKDTRVASLENGQLVELFIEREDEQNLVGNIYKGRVEGVVPSLQAAFVDIGFGKNAFLHFSDLLFASLPRLASRPDRQDKKGRSGTAPAEEAPAASGRQGRKRPKRRENALPHSIEEALFPGDELLVQVIKEPFGGKGPRVCSSLSLPGRYLVLLPYEGQSGGISKKIADSRERDRLKKILHGIQSKHRSHSFIVRTAGEGRSADEITKDVDYLEKEWRAIQRKQEKTKAPALVHNDQDILYRLTRDIFSTDIDEIWVDSTSERNDLKKHMKAMIPELAERVMPYKDRLIPIFEHFGAEKQIRQALRRKVWLKSGGYLIFDEMEAMTAVDVNSGKYSGKSDQDKMIFKTNIEASHAVARQIRLRDIGGLIVVDFIDMDKEENRRSIKGEFQASLRGDRARISLTAISEFGLVEMTRQRVRRSLRKQLFHECPCCRGEGLILNDSEVWRLLKDDIRSHLEEAPRPNLEMACHPNLYAYIHREKDIYESLERLENVYRIKINLKPDEKLGFEDFHITEIEKPGARKRKPSIPKERDKTEERVEQARRMKRTTEEQELIADDVQRGDEEETEPPVGREETEERHAERFEKDERSEMQEAPLKPAEQKRSKWKEKRAKYAERRRAEEQKRAEEKKRAEEGKHTEERKRPEEKKRAEEGKHAEDGKHAEERKHPEDRRSIEKAKHEAQARAAKARMSGRRGRRPEKDAAAGSHPHEQTAREQEAFEIRKEAAAQVDRQDETRTLAAGAEGHVVPEPIEGQGQQPPAAAPSATPDLFAPPTPSTLSTPSTSSTLPIPPSAQEKNQGPSRRRRRGGRRRGGRGRHGHGQGQAQGQNVQPGPAGSAQTAGQGTTAPISDFEKPVRRDVRQQSTQQAIPSPREPQETAFITSRSAAPMKEPQAPQPSESKPPATAQSDVAVPAGSAPSQRNVARSAGSAPSQSDFAAPAGSAPSQGDAAGAPAPPASGQRPPRTGKRPRGGRSRHSSFRRRAPKPNEQTPSES